MPGHGKILRATPVPKTIPAGSKAFFVSTQLGNSRGTSGAAAWSIVLDGEHRQNEVMASLMWSVPYSKFLYNAYKAVGLSNKLRSSMENFQQMYSDKNVSVNNC